VKVKKKETWTQVRLSDTEKKMVAQQAEKLGLTVSAYLRMLIYQKEEKSV
jgi:antitoxin component of RelBE/YafQ-DinJ toxin-antitoxin module